MNFKMTLALLGIATLSACSGAVGGPFDVPLSHPKDENVGIWVSPQGCESWYFIEGTGAFMSPRMRPDGKPVCNAPPAPARAASN